MAKTILTPKQSQFLKLVQVEPQITKWFYLTGGTALSEFYLKHRLSEDLDFFSENREVDQKLVDAFLKKISPKLRIGKIKRSVFLGLVSYYLIYKDGKKLKVDFNYYPFPRIEKGQKISNLVVDSMHDIAANKMHTIFMKPRDRDYLDLYFIIQKEKYSIQKLIIDAKTKFDWHIDKLTLASQFLRVKDIKTLETPRLLVPFHKKKLDNFFLEEATKLQSDIFKA